MVEIQEYDPDKHLEQTLLLSQKIYPHHIQGEVIERVRTEMSQASGSVALESDRLVGMIFYDSLSHNFSRWHDLVNKLGEARQILHSPLFALSLKEAMRSYYVQQGYPAQVDVEAQAYFSTLLDVKLSGGEGYLRHLAVHERFRRQGIGEKLVQKQLDRAKELGSGYVFTDSWIQGGSHRLFIRVGFEPLYTIGTVDHTFLYMGKKVD